MDYDKAIEVIKKVESEDTTPKSVRVDLIQLGTRFSVREYSDEEVQDVMGFIEDVDAGQSMVVESGVKKHAERRKAESALSQAAEQQQEEQARRTGAPKITESIEAAAGELEAAVSKAGKSIGEMREKKANEKLVLPNLSLNDQISELEKISLGLDGNVFTHDQLEIIKLEVNGLARRKYKPKEEFDKELAGLRDKRLQEVINKLSK